MKRLLFLIPLILAAIQSLAQTSNLPSSLGEFTIFRESPAPFTIVMPPGYSITSPVVEVWNNGIKLSDSTDVTVSGDTIKFTLTKEQIVPLERNPYVFLKMDGAYVLGAPLKPTIGVGIPSSQTKTVNLPNQSTVRVSVIGDASLAIQAADRAKWYRDSTQALFNTGSVTVQSRKKFGTIAALRANTENVGSFEVIEGGKTGTFYYDPADNTSADDGALVIVNGSRRYKRVVPDNRFKPEWWGANGLATVTDLVSLQKASDAAQLAGGEVLLTQKYYLPGGVIWNVKTNISGFGTVFTEQQSYLNIAVDNVTISGITIDGTKDPAGTVGGSSGRGFSAIGRSNITISKAKMVDLYLQGFYGVNINGIRFTENTVAKTLGITGGDGFYCKGCNYVDASGNDVSGFNRIGICVEGFPDNPTYNVLITRNFCHDAVETSDYVNYPNAGIWVENTAGAQITVNRTLNTYARGIVMTPDVDLGTSHEFIATSNRIENCLVGLAFPFSRQQIGIFSNNTIIDAKEGMSIGDPISCLIEGNIFKRKNQEASWFLSMVRISPLAPTAPNRVKIANCINEINAVAIVIAGQVGNGLNLTISDCEGNWAYLLTQYNLINSKIRVSNTTMDWSSLTTDYYVSNNTTTIFEDCDITFPAVRMISQGSSLTFKACRITAPSQTILLLGTTGVQNLRIEDSEVNNLALFGVGRSGQTIILRNSQFEGYHPTSGLFQTSVGAVTRLDIFGCSFSRSLTITPIQITAGVTTSAVGDNYYISTLLFSGFMPTTQSSTLPRGTNLQRPTTAQEGYYYYDTVLNRILYWAGADAWQIVGGGPIFATNTATTAPTKSTLNTTYGSYNIGSVVRYPNISGGARSYRKVAQGSTSDWDETVWATGVTTQLP